MDRQLQNLIDECKRSLEEAVNNPEHPWRLLVASNSDLAGNPQSRYVVLRSADNELGKITFFTDQRSSKVPSLSKSPRISLCFFDPLAKLQLEIKASVKLYNNNEVSQKYWNDTSWYSLQCYYMNESPGEKLEAPFMLKANAMDEKQAFRFFTVVECTSIAWDILLLTNEGNQRASCTFDSNGAISAATWVAP